MSTLADLLADCVLADAILILPCSPIPPTNIRMVRGPRKSTENSTKKTFTSKRKKGDVGMAKQFSKMYG